MPPKTRQQRRPAKASPPKRGRETAAGERTEPELWARVKAKWHRGEKGGPAGVWTARKAQFAVQEYKRRGGGYRTPPSRANSLRRWTRQEWTHLVPGEPDGRYLPRAVAEKIRRERPDLVPKLTREKKRAGGRGSRVPYTDPVLRRHLAAAGVIAGGPRSGPGGPRSGPGGPKKAPGPR